MSFLFLLILDSMITLLTTQKISINHMAVAKKPKILILDFKNFIYLLFSYSTVFMAVYQFYCTYHRKCTQYNFYYAYDAAICLQCNIEAM